MSRIASCPACHGEISILPPPRPVEQMLCPLCHAQFALVPVLATSVEAPPAALPVEPPHVNVPAAVGPSLSQVEDVSQWQAAASRSVARQKPRGPSVLGQLIGIVGGGALGLAIGYVILLRVGGAQYDFLEIAHKLPHWMVPPAKAAPREEAESADSNRGGAGRSLADLANEPDQPLPANLPVDPVPPLAPTPTVEPDGAPPPDNVVPQLGVRNPTMFTSDELGAALGDANSAMGCEHCNSTGVVKRTVVTGTREVNGKKIEQTVEKRMPCEACGGKPALKLTPEVYEKLARLADVTTFLKDPSAWHRREGVQNLLLKVGSDLQRAETMGRLAGFRLENAAREQKGIAIAGTVEALDKEGPLHTMRIVLFGLPKVVTVVSARPAQPVVELRDRVIILGSIVDNPKENLVGYEGQLAQVVWGGLPVKLPAAP